MAKAPSGRNWNPLKFLDIITGGSIAEKIDKDERKFQDKEKTAKKDRITDKERSKLIDNLRNTNNRPAGANVGVDDYIDKLFRDSTQTTTDNARIRKMTPEIAQASAFMVSAIISPNDLRQGEISIKCDETSLSSTQRTELEEYLKEYYEERFELSVNLPKWIDEALYISGAKCLLTVPMSSLEKQILRDGENVSKESFDRLESSYEAQKSLFGISSDEKDDYQSIATETLDIATESFNEHGSNLGFNRRSLNKSKFTSEWNKFAQSVISKESLDLSDNPFKLRGDKMRNKIAKQSMKGVLATLTAIEGRKSKSKNIQPKNDDANIPFVQMTHTENDHIGEPMFSEVPTESVIPVYVPGSPSNALGYLLVIDQNGHFASIGSNQNKSNGPTLHNGSDRYNFDQLYAAAGFNANMGARRSSESESVMAKLYQSIVEGYLDEKIQKAGYKNISLGSNPAVYKYMFAQYLNNRQTRLMYVPADMLTYFTFEHGPDGRGVSDLERAKYILSLRCALQTSKTISALNAAIDRKKLTITNEGDANSGYALQQIESIIHEHIQKNRWSITTDPQQTANQLVEKAYSVNVKGIPGLNYEVEDQVNQKESSPIDDSLTEELYKQLIMSLFIPAAAMNALDGDEYSRSVVTANLFTSNLVMSRQRVVVAHISEMLRNYTHYSPTLRKGILEIIADPEDESDKKTTNGNIDPTKLTSDDKERLGNIIDSIEISLPPPNIAPNKAMYEVINDTASAADTLVNSLYPDEIVGQNNPTLQEALAVAKASCKNKFIKNTMDSNGLDSSFLINLEDLYGSDITKQRQFLINLSKEFKRQAAVMGLAEDAEEAGGGAGGSFGGGGFGGGDMGGDSGGFGGDMGGGDSFGGGDMGGGEAGGFADATSGAGENDSDQDAFS